MRTEATADGTVPSSGVFGAAAGAALRFSLGGLSPGSGAGMAVTGATGAGFLTAVVAMEPL
ncbi:MAG TPA: hypothetical protein VFW64_19660 [Pseudonocardiaceae bacterium]|nr:hypothetical protein [Pseudonocardiaceae bacterium]